MILVTVGTQLPFPRLWNYVETLAAEFPDRFLMQSADPTLIPKGFTAHAFMTPEAITAAYKSAEMIIGHAGVGTILSAQRFGKALIIVPRRFAFSEHRNDHQMATAKQVEQLPGVTVAYDLSELRIALLSPPAAPSNESFTPERGQLIGFVRAFVS